MAIEQRQKEIKGTTYVCTQMPSFRALDVFESLATIAGPALGAVLGGAGLETDTQAVAVALFSRLGGGKLRALAKDLLESVEVVTEGKKRPMLTGFDAEYGGRIFEVLQVMAFAAEVNFGDFFDGARGLFAPQALASK